MLSEHYVKTWVSAPLTPIVKYFILSNSEIERVDVVVLPSKPLDMSDFQKYVYEGHSKYAIFALEAPIEEVLQAVAKYQPNVESLRFPTS